MTSAETTARQQPAAAEATDSADYAKAILNILEDTGEEQARQAESRRAVLNILADLDTEKSRLESTQRALINMLDDLEVERGKVDKVNIELREVNEAMRSFIATAAHDLRSPLASMVGFSSLLTENWATLSEEKRLKFVSTIDRQSHKLTWLVNDLLTLSSIEGGVLNTVPEEIVVADAVAQSLAASGRGTTPVSVSCPPELVIRADPSHVGRMIDNYLQNALKYGEPPVQIEASQLGDMVEIRVIDNGPGVPAEFETKLFGKFARADSASTRAKKGTGLGLSIVRGLAQANGGRASYQPHAPRGACFAVLLPAGTGSPLTERDSESAVTRTDPPVTRTDPPVTGTDSPVTQERPGP